MPGRLRRERRRHATFAPNSARIASDFISLSLGARAGVRAAPYAVRVRSASIVSVNVKSPNPTIASAA
jgi:hypothetical protein